MFDDEDAVNYASGRRYPVRDVERRLTSPLLVASSGCSRCPRTLLVFRKVESEQRAKATVNQRKPLVTHESTKEMLTAITTAETSIETLAHFKARESRWEREMLDNFNVSAFCFVMHVLPLFRGLAHHPFDSVNVSWTRSVAVDREMVESVCSAAEGIFIEYYTLLEKLWQWNCSHDFLLSGAQVSC